MIPVHIPCEDMRKFDDRIPERDYDNFQVIAIIRLLTFI